MRKLRLIAIDLDGTVINGSQENITPRTLTVFERAHSLGCMIAISTGRAVSMVPKSIKTLPFVDYLITSNGACIRRTRDSAVLHHAFLDRPAVWEIVSAAKKQRAAFNVFFEDHAVFEMKSFSYMLAGIKHIRWKDRRQLREARRSIRSVFSIERELRRNPAPIEKMGCSFRSYAESEQALYAIRTNGNVNAVRALENELEITARGVSKGAALRALCGLLHLEASEVAAFGDSGNDLSMRKSAGCFVAMGNATSEVKIAADFVTGTVSEDGVAQWLEQYLLRQYLEE